MLNHDVFLLVQAFGLVCCIYLPPSLFHNLSVGVGDVMADVEYLILCLLDNSCKLPLIVSVLHLIIQFRSINLNFNTIG